MIIIIIIITIIMKYLLLKCWLNSAIAMMVMMMIIIIMTIIIRAVPYLSQISESSQTVDKICKYTCKANVKVKFTLVQAIKAQRRSRFIALLFL